MKKIVIPLIIALVVTFMTAHFVAITCIKGAKSGADDISKMSYNMALYNPDALYWQDYPFGLLIGGGVGLIVFVIGYIISPSKPKL